MKGIAKLILFYTITFVIALLSLSLLKFAAVWIDAARHIPAFDVSILREILRVSAESVPFSLYLSILLTLSYSVRRKIKAPVTILVVLLISIGLNVAVSIGLRSQCRLIERYPPEVSGRVSTLGKSGLMLNQHDITIILLEDPAKPDGSRVVSIPGQPLIYQEKPAGPGNSILPLPSAPFQPDMPYFLESIMLDFSLAARHHQSLLDEGPILFIIYTAAICLLLCSLRFLFTVSRWHLANLFLGALVFRGILTLEIFLNTGEILELIRNFLGNRLPDQYAEPFILTGIAALVVLYSLLVYFARGRLKKDE